MAFRIHNDDRKRAIIASAVKLQPIAAPFFKGQLFYDQENKTITADTGVENVRVQVGQELMFLATATTNISNGSVVYISGISGGVGCVAAGTPIVALANAASKATSLTTLGVATSDIMANTYGMITRTGLVRGIDTSHLTQGSLCYLSAATDGAIVNTIPVSPNEAIYIGIVAVSHATAGSIIVDVSLSRRRRYVTYSTTFTSRGIPAGIYYVNGHYAAPAASTLLSNAFPSIAYGSSNIAMLSKAFVVSGGTATVVGTGVVGLRVSGTAMDCVSGALSATTEVLSEDITTLALNDFLVSVARFVGETTYELYVVSGAPTAYGIDINYGRSAVEQLQDENYTIEAISVSGLAGANDANFDVELLYHRDEGWTYDAAAFVPGNGNVVSLATDLSPNNVLYNNEYFSWCRHELHQVINVSHNEGCLIRITCNENNSVQIMNITLTFQVDVD